MALPRVVRSFFCSLSAAPANCFRHKPESRKTSGFAELFGSESPLRAAGPHTRRRRPRRASVHRFSSQGAEKFAASISVPSLQKRSKIFFAPSGIQNYSIWTSRVLPDRTTIQTRTCLTSQIGRDAVLSRLYGRRYQQYWASKQESLSPNSR